MRLHSWSVSGILFLFSCLFVAADTERMIQVRRISPRRIRVTCTPAPVRIVTSQVNGQPCSLVRTRADGQLKRRDYPALPFLLARIALPANNRPQIDVQQLAAQWVPTALPPQPSAGFVSRSKKSRRRRFGSFYRGKGIFPQRPFDLVSRHSLRGVQLAAIRFVPCQYSAKRRAYRVYSKIVVDVVLPQSVHSNSRNGRKKQRKRSRLFSRMLRRQVLNPSAIPDISRGTGNSLSPALRGTASTRDAGQNLTENGVLLLITPTEYRDALDSFIQWKRQRGLQVEVAIYPDDTGTGTTNLQTFIQGRYNSENLDFIILVGDYDDIPPDTTDIPSDTVYTLLEGADLYHDALISRISANTADDVATQTTKFLLYEKDPEKSGSGAWLAKGVGIASDQGGAGIASNQGQNFSIFNKYDYQIMREELAKWQAAGYSTVDALFDPGETSSEIADAFNAGRGLVYYLGHGQPTSWTTGAFDVTDARALTNTNRPPFIVVGACYVGDFLRSGGDCLAEAFLKAGSAETPTGAVGMVGATTAMDWDPPIVMLEAFTGLLTGQTSFTPGGDDEQTPIDLTSGMVTAGALTFLSVQYAMDWSVAADIGGDGATAAEKIMKQTHLFGDCSLQLRTRDPEVMAVTHPSVIVPGETANFTVTSGGTPVVGATICLFRSPDVQLVTETDAQGTAAILASPDAGDPLTLTVFHPDYLPVQATLPVASGPVAIYSTATLPDAVFNEAYSFSPQAAGGVTPYTWSLSAGAQTVPDWLSIQETTGEISGTPDTPGTWSLTLQVTDDTQDTAQQTITLFVGSPVTFGDSQLAAGTVAAPYSQDLPITGDFPPWQVTLTAGSLPSGLSLSTTGRVSGSPTLADTYNFTALVQDQMGKTDEKSFQLTIQPSATISILTDPYLPAADRGISSWSQQFEAAGGTGRFTWSAAAGSLPPGLTLSTAGKLSGTPEQGGDFSFRLQVTDDATPAHTAEKEFYLSIGVPVYFTTTVLPTAHLGFPWSAPVPVESSYPPIIFAQAGNLPNWLSLSADGILSGTPPTTTPEQFDILVQDWGGNIANATLTLAIDQADGTLLTPTAGWNTLSVTVIPNNPQPEAVFPGATLPVWEWQAARHRYTAAQEIEPMKGYWVYFRQQPEPFAVIGVEPASHTAQLPGGWSLVGPLVPSRSVPTGDPIVPPVWQWKNKRYSVATQLTAGNGYWLHLSAAGAVNLGTARSQ